MTSKTTEIVASPPDIPSKWDIIPIHSSDVASYKRCRRYWDYTSPTRSNLRRRVDIYGVNVPMWYGTGIHYALEMMYHPVLKRDPVEAFLTWYEYQWNGGIVTEEWLERTYDIHAQSLGPQTPQAKNAEGQYDDAGSDVELFKIRGLSELLPDPNHEEFELHRELGIGMLNFYKEWSANHDDFLVVAAESVYSIPLEFEATDRREESPNYGKRLEVHARGKRDAVIFYPESGKYGINDYKTAAKISEEYFLKLDKDEQCSNYLWATIQEAKMHGYAWSGQTVDRVLYTALRKNYPKPPTVLKNGFPSLNRQTEGTTADLFEQYVQSSGLSEWYEEDEKAQAYYTYLLEQGDSLFIQRDLVTRNEYEIEATGRHLRMIAEEMLADDLRIYPNPTGEFRCLQCAFRVPCISADDGSDWQGILLDGYEENKDR